MLLTASCIFYMMFVPEYILILLVTILIDYFAGMKIEDAQSQSTKKLWLWISVVSTIMVLVIFKYANFININVHGLADELGIKYNRPVIDILLPIGLSFHTFQSLSYVIEVYRGHQRTERHFGIYSLYVMFYPQLVAGPIERPQNMLHQFHEKHEFSYRNMTEGLKLMAWGLFKKMVIADRLAYFVQGAYGDLNNVAGWEIIIATGMFAFQVYCDFSGYSDIAIGAGQTMGFKMMTNFRRPFQATSVAEFYARWHISLTTWFRDYVYIPMGGNRVPKLQWLFNLIFVFALSGLWHGDDWTYILWGVITGLYLAGAVLFKPFQLWLSRLTPLFDPNKRIGRPINIFIVYLLFCFTMVIFRAKDLSQAIIGLQRIPMIDASQLSLNMLGDKPVQLILAIIGIIVLLVIEHFQASEQMRIRVLKQPPLIRWSLYLGIVMVILHLGVYGHTNFIYFQF